MLTSCRPRQTRYWCRMIGEGCHHPEVSSQFAASRFSHRGDRTACVWQLVSDDPQICRCARRERKQVTEISGVGGVAENGCEAENLLECPQRRAMCVGKAVRVARPDEGRHRDQCDRTM